MDSHDLRCQPLARVADLSSETGEVAKELLISTGYGRHKPPAAASPELRAEVGDLVFSVVALAVELDVDPGAELDAAVARYEERVRRAATPSSTNSDPG
ncbi:nucleotide pyrophosphohydrolase [Egibacter rhizosphaerae]|uniref:Nucleotide pyrophosphohydrolase n=1 Tax=Egibacter rhizosphaerae TaxID=1670831 RepID=A0A411YJ39_9ACTN|nr:MazG nucleotide pyrophosphohydrolase domain-containing protein [Egibacter rhizosphaerae]QBI21298.1 nucleotide pyrophosphohydrolase [Egibacter rhizosphaerae]